MLAIIEDISSLIASLLPALTERAAALKDFQDQTDGKIATICLHLTGFDRNRGALGEDGEPTNQRTRDYLAQVEKDDGVNNAGAIKMSLTYGGLRRGRVYGLPWACAQTYVKCGLAKEATLEDVANERETLHYERNPAPPTEPPSGLVALRRAVLIRQAA